MKYAFGVLSPFIIAMFIAMLLQRPVNFVIEKTKIPRGIVSTVAVLLVVFVFGTIIGLILSKIFSELKSFFNYIMLQLDNAPLFASQLKDWVNTHFTLLPDSIRQNIISTAANLIDKIQGVDTGSSSSAAAAVASSETAAKGLRFFVILITDERSLGNGKANTVYTRRHHSRHSLLLLYDFRLSHTSLAYYDSGRQARGRLYKNKANNIFNARKDDKGIRPYHVHNLP